VIFVDGTNVNQELLRGGYAWQYRKYCKSSFCSDWLDLEGQARDSSIGLWTDKAPQAPWEWRRAKKNGGNTVKALVAQVSIMAT